MEILGCYNSTPLKWISSPRFGRCRLGDRDTPSLDSPLHPCVIPSCSSIILIRIPLYFACLLTLLQVSCQTDSKILTDTPNNTQVTPITRPPFLFSSYYQFSFLKYPPSNGASLLSWSKVDSIANFKTLMTSDAQIKLLNSQMTILSPWCRSNLLSITLSC